MESASASLFLKWLSQVLNVKDYYFYRIESEGYKMTPLGPSWCLRSQSGCTLSLLPRAPDQPQSILSASASIPISRFFHRSGENPVCPRPWSEQLWQGEGGWGRGWRRGWGVAGGVAGGGRVTGAKLVLSAGQGLRCGVWAARGHAVSSARACSHFCGLVHALLLHAAGLPFLQPCMKPPYSYPQDPRNCPSWRILFITCIRIHMPLQILP